MPRIAFKMYLHPGQAEEYKRRHDKLWPELADLLHAKGISDYHIFLDEESHTLFGTLLIEDPAALDELPKHPVMQRWWAFMGDIMATNEDGSPVSVALREVFRMA
jgi:L-rhamnose mutarotase